MARVPKLIQQTYAMHLGKPSCDPSKKKMKKMKKKKKMKKRKRKRKRQRQRQRKRKRKSTHREAIHMEYKYSLHKNSSQGSSVNTHKATHGQYKYAVLKNRRREVE